MLHMFDSDQTHFYVYSAREERKYAPPPPTAFLLGWEEIPNIQVARVEGNGMGIKISSFHMILETGAMHVPERG